MNKRKNLNPNAVRDKEGTACTIEMAGVDLNRNWGVDFGLKEETQIHILEECEELNEYQKVTKHMIFKEDIKIPFHERDRQRTFKNFTLF